MCVRLCPSLCLCISAFLVRFVYLCVRASIIDNLAITQAVSFTGHESVGKLTEEIESVDKINDIPSTSTRTLTHD